MSDQVVSEEYSSNSTNTKSLKRKTIGGFMWLFGGSGTQSVLQIIVLTILARLVTPREFGIIGAAMVVTGFSRIFSQMGMGPALVQRLELTQAHIRTGFSSSLLIGSFFALILVWVAPYVAVFFDMPELTSVLKVVALIFVIDSFSVVSLSLLQRKLKMRLYAATDVISYAIGYGVIGITLAFLGFGVWALVYGRLGQALLKAIISSYYEPHSVIPYWNFKAFKELFYFGGGYTIAKIANYIALQGDYLVVGKWLGADSLGYYSRAYQIIGAPAALIGGSLDTALFPALSSIQKQTDKLKKAYLRSVELIALVSLPAAVIIIINAPEIILVLLGENWTEAIFPLQILGAGLLFRMSYKVSNSLASAMSVVYKKAWRQIIYALAILAGALAGSSWGINGVAIGVMAAIVLNFLLMAQLSLKELNIDWGAFLTKHTRAFLLSGFTFIVSYLAISQLRIYIDNVFIREFIFLVILIAVILPFCYYLRRYLGIEKEITEATDFIRNRIHRHNSKSK